ncbi:MULTISPECIES: FxDxF family PEP-CTERM protein [unclassified Sphingomonas]|uniref:FxDxF family PEP-CTERM protein n=1 Tax=unclassified Sphingomonas TaxID=196159 RepID=UPI00092A2FB2|nr:MULTISPECIES: FxDxF family PEP-CTERM protein [unclassified Sphingomonas]MBN8846600.1 FxDxF family PEP-CTERM protein [Sphingomonas sp.]OJV32773.1 MAG: hypothetical protein BGO24_06570 [Sphingomonas sp. 67-36]
MAALAFTATQANAAATISCPGGDIYHGCSFSDVAASGSFFDQIAKNASFDDIFLVTLAKAGDVTITLTNTPVGMTFSSLLFDGNPFTVGVTGTTFNVGAGTYQLRLAGTAGPATATSSYSGTINYNPVPEPATWALMILGFGAVAGALRYRRRETAVRFA